MAADIARVIVMGMVALLTGVAATILVLYLRAWAKRPDTVHNRLIALHVWLVAGSYLCFMVGAAADVYQHIGNPLTYRLPLYLIGFGLGIVGLYVTAKAQARVAR